MTREETRELLLYVKMNYPRFEPVTRNGGTYDVADAVVNRWFAEIGWMDLETAKMVLDRYAASENGNKTPTMRLWTAGRRAKEDVRITMTYDAQRDAVVWQPEEGGPKIEIPIVRHYRNGDMEDEAGRVFAFAGGGTNENA